MIRRILQIASLIIISIVTGCGGFYTKESYYGVKKSDGWAIPIGDNRLSTYECDGKSIRLIPSSFSAEKTSEAVFGVPVLPTNKELKASNPSTEVRIRFEYRGGTHACDNSDLSMNISGNSSYPIVSAKYYEIPPDETIYCEYEFKKLVSNVAEFSVDFSTRILDCNIPQLHMRKETGSFYNFTPW